MQDIVSSKPLNNSLPLVTVVVASYNMGQYISQAIDSILAQTWGNLEIIVVDDGSEDNTAEVMSVHSKNAAITYIRNANQGQTKAKNCGIKHAKGEFIAFCDADDMWEPHKLEVQMPLFERPEVGVVYTELSCIDAQNNPLATPSNIKRYVGKVTSPLMKENFVPFGTAVIRKKCVDQTGMFNEEYRMGIDWDLWLRYSLAWEFAYAPKETYIYRVWEGQMSKNYRGRYEFAFQILENFVATNKHRLDKAAVKRAWSDMYIRKGAIYARNEKIFVMPLKNIIKGICLSPLELQGWKALIRLFLGRS
jgi:glycosyltransferase involved in cell wall biosynthesis